MNKKPDKSIKYIMYLRKSTDAEDRQIQSIENQEKELMQLIKSNNLNVVKVFKEAQTAKKPGRPDYQEMVRLMRSSEADGILCWKPNRLARNPIDGGEIQWLLQQGIVKSLLTPSREYLPTDNIIMLAVEFGMANQYSLDLSRDVKRGMKAKAEKGWRPHQAPIGYQNDKHAEQGRKRIYVNEQMFPIVRKMWDHPLTGNFSVQQIAKLANDQWGLRTRKGGKLSLSSVYKIFTNRFYYGEFEYAGEIYEGKHRPMITPQEFDRAQQILGKAGKARPKHKRLPFTGLIRCATCGCSITCEDKYKYIKSTGETRRYIYHRCTRHKRDITCHQPPIKHEDLKAQIEEHLEAIAIPKAFLSWAIKVLREQHELEQQDRNTILKNHHKNYQHCVKRIDALIDLYTSPDNKNRELLTKDEYQQRKQAVVKEKVAIEAEMRNTEARVSEWLELTEKTFEFATYAKVWFEEGNFETKTSILRALGQNFVLKDKKLHLDLKKPYLVIKEGLATAPLEKPVLELMRNPDTQAINAANKVFADRVLQWSG